MGFLTMGSHPGSNLRLRAHAARMLPLNTDARSLGANDAPSSSDSKFIHAWKVLFGNSPQRKRRSSMGQMTVRTLGMWQGAAWNK